MNDPIVTLLGNWASELGTYSVLLRLALSVTLGALDANVDVNRLALDGSGLTLPKGIRVRLRRDGDNLVLRMTKAGFMLIVK